MVLMPKINGLLSFLLYAVVAALMALVTYEFQSARLFLKTLLCFYAVSFSFSGIMYAIWYCAAPQGMIWRSGMVYFNISPLFLIILTVLCYLILTLLQRLVGRQDSPKKFFSVEVEVDGRKTEFRAMLDTGNTLVERMSGAPVIVAEYNAVKDLIPEELTQIYAAGEVDRVENLEKPEWRMRFRLIPFAGVGTQSLLPAFFPDKVAVDKQVVDRACAVSYTHPTLPTILRV